MENGDGLELDDLLHGAKVAGWCLIAASAAAFLIKWFGG